MRRLLALVVMLSVLLMPGLVQAESPIRLIVNGAEIKADVPPVIEGGRTLVPLRALTEALGFAVAWEPETQTITLTKGNRVIVLYVGKNEATVDGKSVPLDVPPMIREGRTLVPVRFVAEQLGLQVSWDGVNQVVQVQAAVATAPAQPPAQPPAAKEPAMDPAVTALINQANQYVNMKVTGDFAITIGSAQGSLKMGTSVESYTKGQEQLTLTTVNMLGMEQKGGNAVYQGQVWMMDPNTGAWEKMEGATLPTDATSDPTAYAEMDLEMMKGATITLTEEAYEGEVMSKMTAMWDREALEKMVGAEAGEMTGGQMKIVYWVTKAGVPHHMDLLMEMEEASSGTKFSMEGTMFLTVWEEPIPFPAEITGS